MSISYAVFCLKKKTKKIDKQITAFYFSDSATPESYTLSLHDALPICFGPEEQLIRSAYAKLSEYNDAVKTLKKDLGRQDVEAGSGLKLELSNFQTGPIQIGRAHV